jgi:hypothetical protein
MMIFLTGNLFLIFSLEVIMSILDRNIERKSYEFMKDFSASFIDFK